MITKADVAGLDERDPLAHKRLEFELPVDRVYLDGNSLGALPRAVSARLQQTLDQQWGCDLIESWTKHDWINLPVSVGEKIAPLIGAAPGQVACADSISVNLFKLLAVALALRPGRSGVLSASDNFPTDLYMAQGLEGLGVEGSCRLLQVAEADIAAALDDRVAVLLLSHVNFRSGRLLPMQELTAAAHEAGALVIWDLAHSAGAMPVALDECGVDFAVGCGYKYFNGGPGAPAFLYVADRHQDTVSQPLSGWMGHRAPFEFNPLYEPAVGVTRYLCGTPPILSMSALDAALDLFGDVDMAALRNKSLALGTLFTELVEQSPLAGELNLFSPAEPEARGSQLSWSHAEAYGLVQALIERGVVTDFREPDLLRVGFSPLYNSHADVYRAVETLAAVIAAGEHLDSRWQTRKQVT